MLTLDFVDGFANGMMASGASSIVVGLIILIIVGICYAVKKK